MIPEIIIHNLRRYKISFIMERVNETEEIRIDAVHYQDPLQGWSKIKNPAMAFEIADLKSHKLSSNYLKEVNPGSEFLSRRKKEASKEKRSRKKSKGRDER